MSSASGTSRSNSPCTSSSTPSTPAASSSSTSKPNLSTVYGKLLLEEGNDGRGMACTISPNCDHPWPSLELQATTAEVLSPSSKHQPLGSYTVSCLPIPNPSSALAGLSSIQLTMTRDPTTQLTRVNPNLAAEFDALQLLVPEAHHVCVYLDVFIKHKGATWPPCRLRCKIDLENGTSRPSGPIYLSSKLEQSVLRSFPDESFANKVIRPRSLPLALLFFSSRRGIVPLA